MDTELNKLLALGGGIETAKLKGKSFLPLHSNLISVTNKVRILSYMIRNFIHKGLERFYKTGKTSGIQSAHAKLSDFD